MHLTSTDALAWELGRRPRLDDHRLWARPTRTDPHQRARRARRDVGRSTAGASCPARIRPHRRVARQRHPGRMARGSPILGSSSSPVRATRGTGAASSRPPWSRRRRRLPRRLRRLVAPLPQPRRGRHGDLAGWRGMGQVRPPDGLSRPDRERPDHGGGPVRRLRRRRRLPAAAGRPPSPATGSSTAASRSAPGRRPSSRR